VRPRRHDLVRKRGARRKSTRVIYDDEQRSYRAKSCLPKGLRRRPVPASSRLLANVPHCPRRHSSPASGRRWQRGPREFHHGLLLIAFYLATCAAGLAEAQTLTPNPPYFTAAGVVQAATQTAETLAPNTIATIYGSNLSWTTQGVTAADLNHGTLPTSLDGVSVYVQGILANLLYVSPGQINFLIPYEITLPSVEILVVRQGIGGPLGANGRPSVIIQLAATAPGFFEWNGDLAVAQHADGSLITPTSPANGGEVVVLYAAGLGRTIPDSASGVIPSMAAVAICASQLQILLNGVPVPAANIYYAGLTPGFAGLYQINVRLPDAVPPNPQIQIVTTQQVSPPGVLLSTLLSAQP
jgi:uncharacterized protein (TIGR03437 family)